MITALKYLVLSLMTLLLGFPLSFINAQRTEFNYQSTFQIGGTNGDFAYDVATDSLNDVYTLGTFTATVDFDPSIGIDSIVSNGGVNNDIFLTKYDASGNYIRTITFGNGSNEFARSLSIDSNDNVYITGIFAAIVDFDPTLADNSISTNGSFDVFVSKFDSAGNYLWTQTFGGAGYDNVFDSGIDSADNIYLTGVFVNTVDFDTTGLVDNRISVGGDDVYTIAFDPAGTYLWANTFGSASSEQVWGITVDSLANVYIAGSFSTTVDFDPSVGVDSLISNGSEDGFMSKYTSGGAYDFTYTFGGIAYDYIQTIYADPSDNIYIAGIFEDTVDFDPTIGIDNRVNPDTADSFTTRINADGSYLWTNVIEGNATQQPYGIAVDSLSNIYVTGIFTDTMDFDPAGTTNLIMSGGQLDAFVTKYTNGGLYQSTYTFSGLDPEFAFASTVDSNDNIYTVGFFDVITDFDSSGAVNNYTSNGASDAFLVKYGQDYFQHIDGLIPGLTAIELNTLTSVDNELVDSGIPQGAIEDVRLSFGATPLADVSVDFSQDRDWSGVTGEVDAGNGMSFVHDLRAAPGVLADYTLYIPKLTDSNTVGFCPGATSISQLTTACPGYVVKTEADSDVSVVNISGQDYWAITGVSGSGGFSVVSTLPNTGINVSTVLGLSLVLMSFGFALVVSPKKKN